MILAFQFFSSILSFYSANDLILRLIPAKFLPATGGFKLNASSSEEAKVTPCSKPRITGCPLLLCYF